MTQTGYSARRRVVSFKPATVPTLRLQAEVGRGLQTSPINPLHWRSVGISRQRRRHHQEEAGAPFRHPARFRGAGLARPLGSDLVNKGRIIIAVAGLVDPARYRPHAQLVFCRRSQQLGSGRTTKPSPEIRPVENDREEEGQQTCRAEYDDSLGEARKPHG